MLPELDRAVAQWRRRVFVGVWLERLGWHLALGLFAAGAAVLALRVGLGLERAEAATWLALAGIAIATAAWSAHRSLPDTNTAAAWLDVRSGSSGLIVTASELGDSPWTDAARSRIELGLGALPRVAWERSLRPIAPALVFAAGALWIEPPREVLGPPPGVANAALERVEEKLATLEESLRLEPELAAELERRLEQVEAEADTALPESTFEALDRLDQRVEASAEEALDAAARANDDLASATSEPSLADAQAALERALESMRAAGLDKRLPEEVLAQLDRATLKLPPGVQLDSATLAKLSQSLRGELDARLAKLAKAGLLSAKDLQLLGELGNLDDFDFEHVCDEDCKKPGGT